jgi:hypothetical protein
LNADPQQWGICFLLLTDLALIYLISFILPCIQWWALKCCAAILKHFKKFKALMLIALALLATLITTAYVTKAFKFWRFKKISTF